MLWVFPHRGVFLLADQTDRWRLFEAIEQLGHGDFRIVVLILVVDAIDSWPNGMMRMSGFVALPDRRTVRLLLDLSRAASKPVMVRLARSV